MADVGELIIKRGAVESVLLEVGMFPGHLSDNVVDELLTSPAFRELGHGALELASKAFPGSSAEAKSGYDGILLGVALALDVLRHQETPDEPIPIRDFAA